MYIPTEEKRNRSVSGSILYQMIFQKLTEAAILFSISMN